MDMDIISRLVLSLDGLFTQFSRKNRRDADDYYHGVHPVSDNVLKLHGSTFVRFYELKGIGFSLSEDEKMAISERIERDMAGYLYDSGFQIQFTELSDKDVSDALVEKSMRPSIDELEACGLGHEVLTTQYVNFVKKRSRAKTRYVAVFASPESLKKRKGGSGDESAEGDKDKDLALDVLGDNADEQAFFITEKEKRIISRLNSFSSELSNAMKNAGVLLNPVAIPEAASEQKRSMYEMECPLHWRPTLGRLHISKSGAGEKKAGKVGVTQSSLVGQIVTRGGTDENLPTDIFLFGDRYFTTFTMVLPQESIDGNYRKNYLDMTSRFPKDVNFLASQRMTTAPFETKEFIVESVYTAMSTIFVGTNNLKIRQAHQELKSQNENKDTASVFLAFSIVVYNKDLNALKEQREQVAGIVNAWNSAQFRSVERDKLKGFMESVPGATVTTSQHQVFERFANVLYQSPVFSSGIPYESGYIHFFTEDGQPYPIEEHSSFNINFNVFIGGTSGGGKSTLLSVLNLAFMAKPKVNPKLSGEIPLKMDIDFGKTSFGLNNTCKNLVPENKKHLFLTHDFTTGIESSMNPHDLTLGLTRPTPKHKSALVRFLLIIFGNVKQNDSGQFKPRLPELESMMLYLVDAVYEYRANDNQRAFDIDEFSQHHKRTIAYMDKLNIKYDKYHSYYYLADLVMAADPKQGPYHAAILRRYGYPRMTDYFSLIDERPELASRFDKGIIAEGLTPLEFFKRELGNVINQFPCFSNVTRVSIDLARMISFDMRTVVGDSEYLKAVFMSAFFIAFFVKRESTNRTPDLLRMADPIYHKYLKRMDLINTNLPGCLNIEEAHIVMQLFNDVIKDNLRQNRKDKWGLRTVTQNITDPDDDYFSLCSTVYITSNQAGEHLQNRLTMMNASEKERYQMQQEIRNRRIFVYILANPDNPYGISRVGVLLNNTVSPGILWASANDQDDTGFKRELEAAIGPVEALKRLCEFFPTGSVRSKFDKPLFEEQARLMGYSTVYEWLMADITENTSPSPRLKALLED